MIKAKKNQLEIDYSVILDIPVEKIDLVGWIRNFNADEYRACTPATGDHKAMIAYCDGEGENIYRNDERCGPVGMVQLYREAEMERDHIFLVSPATRGVLLGSGPCSSRSRGISGPNLVMEGRPSLPAALGPV